MNQKLFSGRPKGSTNGAKRKLAKDPNKPKRPTSAYFYFVAEKREEQKKAGRKITKVAEWTKEVSAIWREISDKDKKPFEAMAAKDKARYDEEVRKKIWIAKEKCSIMTVGSMDN